MINIMTPLGKLSAQGKAGKSVKSPQKTRFSMEKACTLSQPKARAPDLQGESAHVDLWIGEHSKKCTCKNKELRKKCTPQHPMPCCQRQVYF